MTVIPHVLSAAAYPNAGSSITCFARCKSSGNMIPDYRSRADPRGVSSINFRDRQFQVPTKNPEAAHKPLSIFHRRNHDDLESLTRCFRHSSTLRTIVDNRSNAVDEENHTKNFKAADHYNRTYSAVLKDFRLNGLLYLGTTTTKCFYRSSMAKIPIPATAPLQSRHPLRKRYKGLIALPCCNEFDTLPETLKSLEKTAPQDYGETLIIVNVNQRASMAKENNLATLEWLRNLDTPLHLAWLDHVTESAAYPEKFGVGLARHQACSSGLRLIDDKSPVISLDADSPVNPEYLTSIFAFLRENSDFKAGHVNFKHRHCGTEAEKQAIRVYEQHLHQHRQLLEEANSPHAWYAIGSTIVCTKEAYIKAGGYHCRRMAGEDFYLLQQLSKVGCKISMIEDAFVYPSDRVSDRVPFGTGKAVADIIDTGNWLSYHPHCYRDLGQLLIIVEENLSETAEVILKKAPPGCKGWLRERDFKGIWPKLQDNSRNKSMLLQRFHEWLDAFQTLKLIHHLSDNPYPRVEMTKSTKS